VQNASASRTAGSAHIDAPWSVIAPKRARRDGARYRDRAAPTQRQRREHAAHMGAISRRRSRRTASPTIAAAPAPLARDGSTPRSPRQRPPRRRRAVWATRRLRA